MPKSKRQKVATSPRRFELIIDGVQFRCAAFESAHKLDALLSGHCAKVLMGIAIRLFLVIDAFSQFSGTPLACSADLSLCLAKQLLDSIATASG
ncbi:MAG: hypothetical protein ACYCV6_16455 [Steroidobacteraceae bacterium]